eukprot:CAMPEP_0170492412 /NCGR_PEP_ID=MMETSP0208-20121228/12208_1 /TAXON_ID=197538 /ORGANISM="Strombidium inclinatum, Strain S3" /LENGTH=73 /DNA_ID=CAMNT_0010768147 /DNA_START=1020 /DNA_END=1241 /DNA_ORIENTATION=-
MEEVHTTTEPSPFKENEGLSADLRHVVPPVDLRHVAPPAAESVMEQLKDEIIGSVGQSQVQLMVGKLLEDKAV